MSRGCVLCVVLGFVLGALLLCAFSAIQKSYLGVNPLEIRDYIVPFFFGGMAGAMIGYLWERKRALLIEKLQLEERALEELESRVRERTAELAEAYEQMRESEEMHRTLVENLNDVIFTLDARGCFTYLSPAIEKAAQWKAEEMLGRPCTALVHPEDASVVQALVECALAGKREQCDVRVLGRDGTTRHVHISSRPLMRRGERVGVIGVMVDITERKRTEEELRRSEQMFRMLFDSSGDAIFIHDLDGRLLDVNRVACERLGYSKEEMLCMTLTDIDTPEHARLVPERIQQLLESGYLVFEGAHVRRDGTVISVEVSARLIDYDGKRAVLSTVRDITERKKAEESLRRLNSVLRAINAVGNLLVHEKDEGELLRRACAELAALEDYFTVSVCLLENEKLVPVAISGERVEGVLERQAECRLIASAASRGLIVAKSEIECRGCPLNTGEFAQVISTPMVSDDTVWGVITIYMTCEDEPSDYETEMIQTLANNLAFALRAIELDELKRKAFEQIDRNIEQFAVLVDGIRNPLSVIVGLAELRDDETARRILTQAQRIEHILKQLDEGWVQSEKVREFLRKHV